jgi:CBS domain-containing protein/sporulation protein YlmC with PRC-barrel domain
MEVGMASEVVRPPEEFLYLSELLDLPVAARDGERVGRLVEVGCASDEVFPKVLTYYIRPGLLASVTLAAPAPAFAALPAAELRLVVPTSDLQATTRRTPDEILLRREILDKQIVDTDGARVVRVNDVHVLRARGDEVRVVHVDIGYRGLLRRLGWDRPVNRVRRLLGRPQPAVAGERLLSWRYVVPLRSSSLPQDLRLNVAQNQLAQLHPAELAEILEELDRFEAPAVLQALDVPTAAQALAELSPEAQRLLLSSLDLRRAAALLAAMPPDEAADLLEELPRALRDRLVDTLPPLDAATVADLLSQKPDTAGAVMNPEVFAVLPTTPVRETIGRLREGPTELAHSHAVLVVDTDNRLCGIVSLVDLLRADAGATLDTVMEPDPPTARAEEPMEEVAELFDRFNLLAMPVVDGEGRVDGVVTVDDVVAWLREGTGREGGLT